ncbi:hypothetical protein [Pararhizobium antarcticum]|uniref:Uncharacterized protein n=1 Tax=Pararhizobium antarcticum TaxID=1798805 RepID=A0A657LV31_9HYPH|nr:hypothetical protein [Pararhizobium antarcticum]OJF99074.1 hypothetical protein AX760_13925 [Pararhizobium antarcticum]
MTVSPSNIWKSASEVLRTPAGQRDKNLHFGETLRGLYFSGSTPKTDGDFAKLLEDLQSVEKSDSGRDD